MALLRFGDVGEAVRDIQDRLAELGFPFDQDSPGSFGDGTRSAVVAFQLSRSLSADGLVGPETWRTMVDAGFRLGDRLLYYRLPMLHGDDVSTVQQELNRLGFDAGIVDGIFGPQTLRAVLDFQQNRGMGEDGIAGPEVLEELRIVMRSSGTERLGRHVIRERVWLRSLPPTVAGQRIFLDPFCRDDHEAEVAWEAASKSGSVLRELGAHPILSRSADTLPPERDRARHANEVAADMVVAFSLPATDVPGVYYFQSALGKSESGEALAAQIASRLGLEPMGRMMPILRETRSTAIVIAAPGLDAGIGGAAARGVQDWLADLREGLDHSPSSDR